jgi:heme-degrading monooxygenase HmoA
VKRVASAVGEGSMAVAFVHQYLAEVRPGRRAPRRVIAAVAKYRRANAEGGPTYEIFTYGRFEVEPGNETAFVDAWSQFATWASQSAGAGTLRLVRDVRNPGRFVSFGQWDDADAVRGWKSSPEFKQRLGGVVRHATEFEPTELVTLAKVRGGRVETHSPPAEVEAIHAPG